MAAAGSNYEAPMKEFFGKLHEAALANPELIGQYTQTFDANEREVETLDQMKVALRDSPFQWPHVRVEHH